MLQIHEGRYLIRLANGSREWVGPEVVALALVAAAGDRAECPEGQGVLVRRSGETVTGGETYYGRVQDAGEVVRIMDEGGRLIIADLLRLEANRRAPSAALDAV